MITTYNKIFPTHILLVDKVIEEEYIDSMEKDIYYNFKSNPNWRELEDGSVWQGTNWQSKYNLHKQPKYKALTDAVNQLGKKYLTDRNYLFEDLVITDMWANILKPGETHRIHTHSNNMVSGVFYVKANKTSGIMFTDPRPQSNVLCPDVSKQTMDNANVVNYMSEKNRLIMFPSWLSHYVPINMTKEDRISIAFNLMFKGKLGSSADYQSTVF